MKTKTILVTGISLAALAIAFFTLKKKKINVQLLNNKLAKTDSQLISISNTIHNLYKVYGINLTGNDWVKATQEWIDQSISTNGLKAIETRLANGKDLVYGPSQGLYGISDLLRY
jgi:hypothetical protein